MNRSPVDVEMLDGVNGGVVTRKCVVERIEAFRVVMPVDTCFPVQTSGCGLFFEGEIPARIIRELNNSFLKARKRDEENKKPKKQAQSTQVGSGYPAAMRFLFRFMAVTVCFLTVILLAVTGIFNYQGFPLSTSLIFGFLTCLIVVAAPITYIMVNDERENRKYLKLFLANFYNYNEVLRTKESMQVLNALAGMQKGMGYTSTFQIFNGAKVLLDHLKKNK